MITFIDENRGSYGVEPICTVLPIAPSTYHEHVAQRRDPLRLSARARRDLALKPEIARVSAENFAVGNYILDETGARCDSIRDRPGIKSK